MFDAQVLKPQRDFKLSIEAPWPDDQEQAYVIIAKTRMPGDKGLASMTIVKAEKLEAHDDPASLLGDAAGEVIANLLRDSHKLVAGNDAQGDSVDHA